MSKFFTYAVASIAMIGTALTAQAADYISVNPSISPRSGTVMSIGDIHISWPGVQLQMASRDKDVSNKLSPSTVTITHNGEVYSSFGDGTGNGAVIVKAQVGTNEGGDGTGSEVAGPDELIIQLPDMSIWWAGNVTVEIQEGTVTSTAGAINPKITLNYNISSKAGSPEWEPALIEGQTVSFPVGEGAVYASWPNFKVNGLNPSGMAPFYQSINSEGDYSAQTNASSYITVENGKLKFDVSSLPAGQYSYCIPEGSVLLSDGASNGEGLYSFTIGNASSMVISPAQGAYSNAVGTVSIMWPGSTVTLNEAEEAEIVVKCNNVVADPDDWNTFWNWFFIDAEGNQIFDDSSEPAAGIGINLPYLFLDEGSRVLYNVEVPAGMFDVADAKGYVAENETITLDYSVVQVNDEVETDPARGSSVPSVKSFTLSWVDYPEARLNYSCLAPVTYGDENQYEVESVVDNEDGTFTVTLPEEYENQGWVSFTFPMGFFFFDTVYGEVFSPEVGVTFNVSVYSVVPGDFATVEELTTVSVFGDNLKLVGSISDIVLKEQNDYDPDASEVVAKGVSYQTVNDDQYGAGIEITFDKTFDEEINLTFLVPAGTLSIGGKDYQKEISTSIFVRPAVEVLPPVVTPAPGTISELGVIEISWADSPLYTSWMYEEMGEPFTLTIDGGTPIDITENVEIVSEMNDNEYFPEPLSSKLVITLSPAYTADGKYVINIPANYVEIANYEYMPNEAMTLTYSVDHSGINGIDADSAAPVYYNLQGQRVANPDKGQVVIKVANGKAEKVIK